MIFTNALNESNEDKSNVEIQNGGKRASACNQETQYFPSIDLS